ncbi:MAG: 23S rRNA (uracil(1939)-C(5))-methyltransferase RlmD [Bacilli bacterium]|nr:23S rRNA (uracil(1939)-C(5))-methyltransferase RlmD [Bacilli bacterium]
MEVEIDRLDHQGRGIANTDKVTFISNALPSEIVDIEITCTKSKYNIGKVKNYKKISDKRIDAVCPYFSECGGCELMHLSYLNESKYKEEKIKDIMKRYAGIDNISSIIKCDKELGYRNKVTFKVNDKLGLYQHDSHNIVNVNKCFLISDNMNKYIDIINKMDLSHIYEVIMRESINDMMIIFMCDEDIDIDTSNLECNVVKAYKGSYKTIKGNNYIIDEIGNMKYKISPTSFFQVNKYQVKKLYDLVLTNLDINKSDRILDLYCGTGTIGIYVSKLCNEVLGIEINEEAIKDANYNKDLNNVSNISFIAGDSKVIDSINFKPNKIIVDPPRAGLDKKVINEIININPERIIYVSCDPITLARDLNILKEKYNIEKVIPVDMFPRTYHVETVCTMTRKALYI